MARIKVSSRLRLTVTVTENRFQIPLDSLIRFAERDNPRRRFLFVSRVLGKHLPCDPRLSLLTGELLGHLAAESIIGRESAVCGEISRVFTDPALVKPLFEAAPIRKIALGRPTLVIGMGETATALGCAAASVFANAYLIHSTREEIAFKPPFLTFAEEHSHAVAHFLYLSPGLSFDHVVLVDDEMSSGQTFINIIRKLRAVYGIRAFTIAAILDWRGPADRQRFVDLERELNIVVRAVCLIAGTFTCDYDSAATPAPVKPRTISSKTPCPAVEQFDLSANFTDASFPGYIKETGRFGLAAGQLPSKAAAKIGQSLSGKAANGPFVCLGYGEFMYLPMIIAAHMSGKVFFHSCTRSPILIDRDPVYGARSGYVFDGLYPPKQKYYLYNLPANYYRTVFLFLEKSVDKKRLAPFLTIFGQAGVEKVCLAVAR